MNKDDMDFINKVGDAYALELLKTIFQRIFPKNSIMIPMLTLCHKHGMPVKNILPFIQELGEWVNEHQDNSQAEFADLLSRSGFMTIGFSPDEKEGDSPDGNG